MLVLELISHALDSFNVFSIIEGGGVRKISELVAYYLSEARIPMVYDFGLRRYKDLKIRVCGKDSVPFIIS